MSVWSEKLSRARVRVEPLEILETPLPSRPEAAPDMPRFWPPKVVWSREKGWLNIRDHETGEWFSIPAREAPRGYMRLAMVAKGWRR
jgi:hypothetical protein